MKTSWIKPVAVVILVVVVMALAYLAAQFLGIEGGSTLAATEPHPEPVQAAAEGGHSGSGNCNYGSGQRH